MTLTQDILIRPARPDDRERYIAAVNSLSIQTRIQRFFMPKKVMLDREVARMMDLDPDVQNVWFAVDETDTVVVGVARCAIETPRAAQVALTVTDAYQGQGLGGALLGRVISAARTKGLVTLTAESLDSNATVAHLLKSRQFVPLGVSHGVVSWRLELHP